jgi:hypothetical protein
MLSTIAIGKSSKKKSAAFSVGWLAQHLLNQVTSGVGEEEGRTVVKRSSLPLAKASV